MDYLKLVLSSFTSVAVAVVVVCVCTGKLLRPPGDERLMRLLGMDKDGSSLMSKSPTSPNKILRTVSICLCSFCVSSTFQVMQSKL